MCTICVTKPICVYNLCDMSENALDAVKTPKLALSQKLYTQIGFVTQIVHI